MSEFENHGNRPVFEFMPVRKGARLPERSTPYSAGLDIFACLDEPVSIRAGEKAVLIPTGLKIFIGSAFIDPMDTTGLCAMLLPRSGLGHKQGLVLGNGTGLIDPDYQGEWFVSLVNRGNGPGSEEIIIKPGDRIAQLVIVPFIIPDFTPVEKFADLSERGAGGFGSTGVSA